jgi:hypothetical protein
MKKLFWGLICVLIIGYIVFITYSGKYTITDDKKQLELTIMNFGMDSSLSNKNNDTEQELNIDKYIDIKQELNLDNKKFSLYILAKKMGYAQLIKGLNNKYKIDSTECGDGYFKNRIIKTNRGKYIIFVGKNPDMKITYTKVELDGKEYKIEIPQQEYYIAYCKVPNSTQENLIDINRIKLFNGNDVDITDEMFRVLIG